MTKRILSFAFLLTFALGTFAQTTEKTFTKAFNIGANIRVKFDLPGPVDIKVWEKDIVRLEIVVGMPSGNLCLVDQLAKVGRYDLKAETQNETLVITAPNLNKVVKVKGEELREHVSYIVFVPKYIEVILPGPPAMVMVQE